MKSKGPRIDPWGTSCFIVPQFENTIWVSLGDFILTICFLSVTKDLNHFSATPWVSLKCNVHKKSRALHSQKFFCKLHKIPPTCIFWFMDWNRQSNLLHNELFRLYLTLYLKHEFQS
jgi:hypothetical protein